MSRIPRTKRPEPYRAGSQPAETADLLYVCSAEMEEKRHFCSFCLDVDDKALVRASNCQFRYSGLFPDLGGLVFGGGCSATIENSNIESHQVITTSGSKLQVVNSR